MSRCPLCHSEHSRLYCRHETGEYLQCSECELVFIRPESYLSAEEEKGRYDLHTNSPDDPSYRKYLSKVLVPVMERIAPKACGLDFGSGPGPTLSKMFEEHGYIMSIYDHFYAKDEKVLQRKYDFITSTEVIEHLFDPAAVLHKLWDMLEPGGILALLTQPCVKQEEFSKWYYKNDPTHVCFFSLETMRWWQKKQGAELEVIGKDIFILKKTR